jgi:hypothetical protein
MDGQRLHTAMATKLGYKYSHEARKIKLCERYVAQLRDGFSRIPGTIPDQQLRTQKIGMTVTLASWERRLANSWWVFWYGTRYVGCQFQCHLPM